MPKQVINVVLDRLEDIETFQDSVSETIATSGQAKRLSALIWTIFGLRISTQQKAALIEEAFVLFTLAEMAKNMHNALELSAAYTIAERKAIAEVGPDKLAAILPQSKVDREARKAERSAASGS